MFLLYLVGVLISPTEEFRQWIFHRNMAYSSWGIAYLKVIFVLIKVVFIVQLLATVVANSLLIKKYGYKAAQYYSDMQDSAMYNIKMLNLSMILTALFSVVISLLGRGFFENEMSLIAVVSVVFSGLLFVIGWLGNKQKPINPAYEEVSDSQNILIDSDTEHCLTRQDHILKSLLKLFENDRIYLKSNVTIQDVANEIGTNRTYVSSIINEYSKQNFCSFVNQYRICELEKILKAGSDASLNELAESTGFGSADSMKRAVSSKTNMSFREWKEKVLANT